MNTTEEKEACEHKNQDDHGCLDCGTPLLADRLIDAADRAKDRRKYGE